MKKISRFGVLLGIVSGATVFVLPAVVAQDGPPGPATEIMEGVDANLGGPPHHPMPLAAMPGTGDMMPPGIMPGMPGMPPMPPGMPPGPPLQGQAAMDGPDLEGMLAMHADADLMMLRAAVHGQFTDDQLEKIFQVKSKFMDTVGPKMAELGATRRALYDQLTQAETDKGKLQSLQGKINALHADIANARLDQQIGLLGVLSSEQRKDLRRGFLKMEDFGMGGMMGGMKHHWRGHGGSAGHGGCGPHGGHGGAEHQEGHETGPGGDHKEHASVPAADKG